MSFKNKTVTIDDQSEPGSWAKAIGEIPVKDINSILEERGSSYGDFGSQAYLLLFLFFPLHIIHAANTSLRFPGWIFTSN